MGLKMMSFHQCSIKNCFVIVDVFFCSVDFQHKPLWKVHAFVFVSPAIGSWIPRICLPGPFLTQNMRWWCWTDFVWMLLSDEQMSLWHFCIANDEQIEQLAGGWVGHLPGCWCSFWRLFVGRFLFWWASFGSNMFFNQKNPDKNPTGNLMSFAAL